MRQPFLGWRILLLPFAVLLRRYLLNLSETISSDTFIETTAYNYGRIL